MSLGPQDFPAWVQFVHGHEPFPWQQRLLDEVLANGWPPTLRLPTSSGKTTAMDVALFALACELAAGKVRTMPLRIAFVVDRRIVVDSAHERAIRIRAALTDPKKNDAVAAVADALAKLGAPEPLHVALMRGGIYREDRWARQPNQPTIACSTVDQIGSRLLHRGYGVSPRTWPIHAGLLGNDALIVLDEAHCSGPFHQTLNTIASLRRQAQQPIDTPWFVTAMTATPRDHAAPFELDANDLSHPVLRRRLEACKPIAREVASSKKEQAFVKAVVDRVEAVAAPGDTLLVVVNRVATARAIHGELAKRLRKHAPTAELLLLTGRSRSVERDTLLESFRARLLSGRDRSAYAEAPCLIVVATQCIEVGADIDADILVTEACPLDALRQRLGRVNRLGERGETPCIIVAREEQAWDGTGAPVVDLIYGEAVGRTWHWLAGQNDTLPLDGGILALGARCDGHPPELDAPAVDAPTLMPVYCDLWAQTGPMPTKSPEPALFLHGRETGLTEVQFVWRADLDHVDADRWADTISLCPPVSGETLAVRLDIARAWLAQRLEHDPSSDVDGLTIADQLDEQEVPMRPALRWRGPERSALAVGTQDLRPGDTLVIPSSYGGCDRFGWSPTDRAPVADLGDLARIKARRAPALRIHSSLLPDGVPSEVRAVATLAVDDTPDDLAERARAALHAWAELGGGLSEQLSRALLGDRGLRIEPHPSGQGVVAIGRAGWALDARDFSDEDETSSCAPTEVRLDEHLRDVQGVARGFAQSIGLSSALQADIALAGYLHDLGKADPRFQAWLHDGNRIAALRGPLLAKSPRLPSSRAASRTARARAGYPSGGRHELLSVRLAESSPTLLGAAHDRDLVLHLIESHHGYCRPFAPVVQDEQPLRVTYRLDDELLGAGSRTELERLDAGPAQRFFRLIRRYGWWGLSYLEAIMRLADHRASESEGKGPP